MGTYNESEKLSWIRETWYTPPREQVSQTPIHMLTPPPAPTFRSGANTLSDEEPFIAGTSDKFGWSKYSDDDFFNVCSKERTKENPDD